MEGLELGNIAFNAPRTINLEDTALIHLILSLERPIPELFEEIAAAGKKEGARIRVGDRMEARLSGPDFAITAVTPEVQAISRTAPTEWKWEVKPRSKGRHRLHLTISILVRVSGESTRRAIRTFDREIDVEVTWKQRAVWFVRKNWEWLWAAILIPVIGWLLRIRKGVGRRGQGS